MAGVERKASGLTATASPALRSPYPLFVEGMTGMGASYGNPGGGTTDLSVQYNWTVSGAAPGGAAGAWPD